MARRDKPELKQVSIFLTLKDHTTIKKIAELEHRSLSKQIAFFLEQAVRSHLEQHDLDLGDGGGSKGGSGSKGAPTKQAPREIPLEGKIQL